MRALKQTSHLVIAALLVLSACGSDDDSGDDGGTSSATATVAADDADADVGSTDDQGAVVGRTIIHRFGETTVPAEPERIVAVGGIDADTVVALGLAPVAANSTPDFSPWLWSSPEMEDAQQLGGAEDGSVNIEEIAALEPDLILFFETFEEPGTWELLSEIAPTVASSRPTFEMDWQDVTREIGIAVGRAEDADTLVADVEARIAEAAVDDEPSLAFAGVVSLDSLSVPKGEDDTARRLLRDLGFVEPPTYSEFGGDETAGSQELSTERLDLLDSDVLMLAFFDPSVRDDFEAQAVFQSVPAVADGRYLSVDLADIAPLRAPTPLALDHFIDEVVPRITDLLPE